MSAQSRAAVSEFARQVRANLHGLSPQEIDDLTEGLDADLAAALADSTSEASLEIPDPVALFGPPASYAAELQAAAGLAVPLQPRRGLRASIHRRVERGQSMVARIRASLAGTRGGSNSSPPTWVNG